MGNKMKLSKICFIGVMITLLGCSSNDNQDLKLDYVYDYDAIDFSELYNVEKELAQINAHKDYSKDKDSLACLKAADDTSISHKKVFRICKKASKNKDPQIEYLLSEFYRLGKGTKRSHYLSFIWAKRAALQDYPLAQSRLGQKYLDALGTGRDVEKGFYWFKKAAANKNLEAIYSMGKIYRLGLYKMPKDNGKAFKWFLFGATLGLDPAQREVSNMFGNGIGVKTDKREAAAWAMVVNNCSIIKNQNQDLVDKFSEDLSEQDLKLLKLSSDNLYNKFGCGKFLKFEV